MHRRVRGGGGLWGAESLVLSPWGAFSHSARTAPVITVFTPVTALKPATSRSMHEQFKTPKFKRVVFSELSNVQNNAM